MKQIKLTQNKYAIIDNADFDLVSKYKWRYSNGYAYSFKYLGKIKGQYKSLCITMHQLINKTPKGKVTDHINRNPLDNRRSNLRTVDKSLNAFNTGLWKHNKSGYKGVSWSNSAGKWLSRLQKNGKVIHLGLFMDIDEAALARKLAERVYAE